MATKPSRSISEEALPSFATSVCPFTNIPTLASLTGEQLVGVEVTIRSGVLTLRRDAGTATGLANGCDYGPGTYTWLGNREQLAKYRAINGSGTVTGWVQYMAEA